MLWYDISMDSSNIQLAKSCDDISFVQSYIQTSNLKYFCAKTFKNKFGFFDRFVIVDVEIHSDGIENHKEKMIKNKVENFVLFLPFKERMV